MVVTVRRFRDSISVSNFPLILTGSLELKGYVRTCVFCKFMFCYCLNVVSSIMLIVDTVSTVNFEVNFIFFPLIFSSVVGALL